jgi:hypothetical protein
VTSIAPLAISTTVLPKAKRKRGYTAQLSAVGGQAPYAWKRVKRKLPKGLKLKASGLVTGKPRVKGTKRFKVRVTDARGTTRTAWVRLKVRR